MIIFISNLFSEMDPYKIYIPAILILDYSLI
ncbi:MAG: hypothetical protein A4E59_00121 [Syntrophorhabdus sp. PtaB.Bin027]|nr:MAG: hypothetical protein A4E59_00121 [Syntrophorhabdus sp. PtaB.Bin027]